MNSTQLIAVAVASVILSKKKTRKRSVCTKEWLLKRKKISHINLLNELKLHPGDWFNYLRMDEHTYFELLNLVTPLIMKKNTKLRETISPHERLTVTLRYLATGRSYEDLKFTAAISAQSLGQIIPETCSAIYKVLRKKYLKFPNNETEWKAIATQFEQRWDFPNCLGSVDGKHVQIIPPSNCGSYFWNYKGTNSLVLMAIANANYEFVMIDFGANGRLSDGGVIEHTLFHHKLINNELKFPQPSSPINSNKLLPYVFIGDEAFSLRNDFLKPFSQKELDKEKRIFNYRLSHARRVIENTFGILASKFRIFNHPINLKLENIEKVVMASCVLHNFLRKKIGELYVYTNNYEVENTELDVPPDTMGCLISLEKGHNRNATESAKEVRNAYKEYFISGGAVEWQNNLI